MAIRQRKWKTEAGEDRQAYVVDYRDRDGKRHIETFERKKDADARQAEIKTDMLAGTHVAPSRSITVERAAKEWLADCELRRKLERATLAQYELHTRLHILPLIGKVRLAELTVPAVADFEARLLLKERSPAMTKKVLSSLCGIVAFAQRQGKIRQNNVRGFVSTGGKRSRTKLKVGVDIPTPAEIRAIIEATPSRYQTLLKIVTLTGMRSSEVRGLRWQDVNFGAKVIRVTQRIDRYHAVGAPKSGSGSREIPLGPLALKALREHNMQCGRPSEGLVFTMKSGRPIDRDAIVEHGLKSACRKAGVVDENGEPKYTGLHALRHFNASWLINRVADGGCELPAKLVQERLGHSKISMTLDTYGHLFPRGTMVGRSIGQRKPCLGKEGRQRNFVLSRLANRQSVPSSRYGRAAGNAQAR